MDAKLFLLEDDISLADGLCYSLRRSGFEVTLARTVSETMERLGQPEEFDLLLLDVTLPDGTGFDVCKAVRRRSRTPIIFLTASDEELSVIMGLDMGADDYITKPFKLGVLLSRINALLRRSRDYAAPETELRSNGVSLSLTRGRASLGETPLELTAAELKLLALFMQNPGVVLSKETVLDKLWDSGGRYVDDNTLAVYIRRLRTKIEDDPGAPRRLVTVRGLGYKWQPDEGEMA